jgi:hypothetical protein
MISQRSHRKYSTQLTFASFHNIAFLSSTPQLLVHKIERLFAFLGPFITQHAASLNISEMWNICRCFISYLANNESGEMGQRLFKPENDTPR